MGKNKNTQLRHRLKNDVYSRPNDFDKEGVDHINISLQSNLEIGRMLDPGYNYSFEYPLVGTFLSGLTLVYWLRDEHHDDMIRGLRKRELSLLPERIRNRPIPNYKAISLRVMKCKLDSKPSLVEAIKKLPEDVEVLSYITHKKSGLRITTGYAHIVVPIVKELIKAVKEDRPINYQPFLNKGGKEENGFIEVILGMEVEEPKKKKRRPKKRKPRKEEPALNPVMSKEEGSSFWEQLKNDPNPAEKVEKVIKEIEKDSPVETNDVLHGLFNIWTVPSKETLISEAELKRIEDIEVVLLDDDSSNELPSSPTPYLHNRYSKVEQSKQSDDTEPKLEND